MRIAFSRSLIVTGAVFAALSLTFTTQIPASAQRSSERFSGVSVVEGLGVVQSLEFRGFSVYDSKGRATELSFRANFTGNNTIVVWTQVGSGTPRRLTSKQGRCLGSCEFDFPVLASDRQVSIVVSTLSPTAANPAISATVWDPLTWTVVGHNESIKRQRTWGFADCFVRVGEIETWTTRPSGTYGRPGVLIEGDRVSIKRWYDREKWAPVVAMGIVESDLLSSLVVRNRKDVAKLSAAVIGGYINNLMWDVDAPDVLRGLQALNARALAVDAKLDASRCAGL